ncbi:MAG: IS3 family transposase [Gemmataceae bacterium]
MGEIARLALTEGLNIRLACRWLDLSRATHYRRGRVREAFCGPRVPRRVPRTLSSVERSLIRAALYSDRFVDRSVREVYATLLDDGNYLGSISTMYRLLKRDSASRERRRQRRHPAYKKPELLANGIHQVWSWDITMIRGPVKGEHYRLYLVMDIFSRYVVGYTLAWKESGEIARNLLRECAAREGVEAGCLTIHSDRGGPMVSQEVSQLLGKLRIEKSHNRPRVSNDNPYSESQFKTLKYRPEFPDRFGSFEEAREFIRSFVAWYNHEHHHEGISLLTPAVVHSGRAGEVLAARAVTMDKAHGRNPERFVRGKPVVRPLPGEVWINRPAPPANQPDTRHELVPKGPSLEAGVSFGTDSCHSSQWTGAEGNPAHNPESLCALDNIWSHSC